MKISRKGRYALRSLIYLSMNKTENKETLSNIAKLNGISTKYLEQIFSNLRRAGIVKSIHGINGGYFLSDKPDKITVEDILEAVEGDYRIESEEIPDECMYKGISHTVQRMVIDEINKQTGKVIHNLTLEDLVREYTNKDKEGDYVYYI